MTGDGWWRDEIGAALAEARVQPARIESFEAMPYFSGWVRRTRDRLELQPAWREWARHWSCRPEHVRAVLALEADDRQPARDVIAENIATLDDLHRNADPSNPPPLGTGGPPRCSVFVSYCHADQELAAAVVNAFTFYLFDVWYDRTVLRLGDSLRQRIDLGMSRTGSGVLLVTPAFLERRWPRIELDGFIALAGDARRRVVPVCVGVERAELRRVNAALSAFLEGAALWLPAGPQTSYRMRNWLLPMVRNLAD